MMPTRDRIRAVLVSHSPILTGGAERSLLEIASYLRSRPEFDVVVAVPSNGPVRDEVVRRDVACVTLTYGWGVFSDGNAGLRAGAAGLHAIRQFLIDTAPDVVMTNTSVVPWFAFLSHRLGIPHAWFLREYVGDQIDIDFYPDAQRALALVRECSDHVFVNSEYMKLRYAATLGRDDIEVVYPAIDRRILDYANREPPGGGAGDEPRTARVLVYGAVLPRKNQLELLEAAALLRQQRDDFTVTIMGPAPSPAYVQTLETFVRDHGMEPFVRFVGNQDVPYDEVLAHDICVVPSVREPFGRVLVEAMTLKRAVVAADAGGNRETLLQAPGAGLLYPSGQPAALAERLAGLLDDPAGRRAMGQRAHEFAVQRFFGSSHFEVLASSLQRLAGIKKARHFDWVVDLLIDYYDEAMRRDGELRAHVNETGVELHRLSNVAHGHHTELEEVRRLLDDATGRASAVQAELDRARQSLQEATSSAAAQQADLEQARADADERRRQLEQASATIAAREADIGQLQRQLEQATMILAAREAELSRARGELSTLRDDAVRREAALESAQSAASRLDAALAETRARLENAERELQHASHHVRALLDSYSWRLTGPMRAVGSVFIGRRPAGRH